MFEDEDLQIPIEDISEFQICNVRQSDDYQGNKLFEGILKKQGSFIKSIKTRWFILRNTGLYYYTSQDEKNCRGKILLSKDSVIDVNT